MSTPDPREPRLPARAEALLEGWPAPSRGALEWEESANAVMTRVRDTAAGSTPDELLTPPLPEEPDEIGRAPLASEANAGRAAQNQEPSLAEIARAALTDSDAGNKAVARDGLIAAELGRKNPPRELTPSPRAVASASVAELQGRVARVSQPVKRPEPNAPMIAVATEVGAPPVVEAAARSEHPAALSERKGGLAPAIFGGSVLALAAAAALYVSVRRHDTAREAPLSAATEHLAPPVQAQDTPEPPQLAASAKTVAPSAIALDELRGAPPPESPTPEAAPMPARKSLAFRVKKETNPGAGKLVLEERDEASNAAPASAPPAAQAAAPAPTTLAERPSTGAIQGAFGAVLTSARSCLAGQETGTRAVVTFDGPTGRVKSVVLEGPGAGSPAEPCVRAALMAAKLSPFAEPSYTASVTVRPL